MRLDARVIVKLRSHAALTRSGLFLDPDQVGVTTVHAAPGRRPDSLQIALSAGMPALTTRAVLAHEYGHALLFDRMAYEVPLVLAEGFAEFVAYTYLTRDEATAQASTLAEGMLTRPDPVYGDGLRLIRAQVDHEGFHAVWSALTAADPVQHLALLGTSGGAKRRGAVRAGSIGFRSRPRPPHVPPARDPLQSTARSLP